MAKSLRNTTMKVKIEVDSKALNEANKRIDSVIESIDKLEKRANQSGKIVEETGQKYKNASESIKGNSDSLKENANRASESQRQHSRGGKALEETEKKYKGASESIGKNSDSLRDNASRAKEAGRQHSDLADKAKKSSDKFKDQKKYIDDSSRSLRDFESAAGKVNDTLMTIGTGYLSQQMYDLSKAAIVTGMEFDKQMSAVKTISGSTADEFKAMRDQAIELGASTSKSASEVAAGQLELAKSGYSAQQTMQAMPGIISASTASGEDMARTSEVVTAALNGFQMQASDANHVADVLAMTANKSKADINDLGYAFKYAAAPAKTLGMSLEETAAATAIMTNAGLAGEQAGTSLRMALIRLSDAPEEASKKIQQLGVDITDADGNMRPFGGIMNDLRKSTEGMGNAQKLAAISTIFGAEAATGMLNVIDAGPEKFNSLTKALENSDGASKKAADSMSDNFAGSVQELGGTIESIAINVSDVLTPTVQKGTEVLSTLGNGFNNLSPSAKSMVVWGSIIVGGVIPASFALYKVHKAVKSIREVMGGAKGFFSDYRRELDKTGDKALETASKMEKASEAMDSSKSTSKASKTSKTKSYSELMKEANNKKFANSAAEEASETATKTKGGFFSKAGSRMKEGMKFSGASKAVPIVGTALAATSLIGMTKDTVGEDLGGFGGSLAGGAAGAAIGSVIAPGIGTAIGGAVGAFAGSSFGEKFGASVQKKWPSIVNSIDGFTEKHPMLTKVASVAMPVAGIALAARKEFKSLKKEYVDISDPTIKFGKNVKKVTSEAVNSYMSLESKTKTQLGLLATNGEKYSKSAKDSVNKNFNSMVTLVEKSFKRAKDSSKNNLSTLAKEGFISEKDKKDMEKSQNERQKSQLEAVKKSAKNMVDINNKSYEEQKKVTQKAEEEINKIKKAAADKGLALSNEDREKIRKIEADAASARKKIAKNAATAISKEEEKQRKNVVASLSRSEKQQKLILGRLEDESGKISARQAASIVKSAEKARKGSVKEANEKFNKVKKAAEEEYYVNGTISEEQYKKIIKEATKTRDESIEHAKTTKEETVSLAQKQAEEHIKAVNWETGDTLTAFQQWGRDVSKSHGTVIKIINKVLKFVGKDPIPLDGMETSSAKEPVSRVSDMPAKAIGTNSYPGGKGLVGEEGVELAYKPFSGKATLLGTNGPEIAHIEPGTRILNHRDTMAVLSGGLGQGAVLPGYDNGNSTIGDFAKSAKSKVSDIWSDTKDNTSAIMDFIMDPVKSAKELFSHYGGQIKNDIGYSGDLGLSIFKKLGGYMGDSLKEKFADFTSIGAAGAGVERWRSLAAMALAIEGQYSAANLQRMLYQMDTESSGNPRAINLWDSNAKKGTPSKGLMQVIDPTYASYHHPTYNKGVYDPLSNMLASIRYAVSRYGSLAKAYRGVGYKDGGRKNVNGQVLVGEEGPELVDLPFGSYVNNNRKTNELLRSKNEAPTINFNCPITINITGNPDSDNISKLERAIDNVLEKKFRDLRALINSGVAY